MNVIQLGKENETSGKERKKKIIEMAHCIGNCYVTIVKKERDGVRWLINNVHPRFTVI